MSPSNSLSFYEIAGISISSWLEAYRYCFDNCSFRCWPDGKPYNDQPDVVVKMMQIINDESVKVKETK